MKKKEKFDWQKIRKTKNFRLILLAVLFVILGIMWFCFEKMRIFIIGLMIVVLAALGMEFFDYDLDLGRLWETGSLDESRVKHTKDGIALIGSCVEVDLNCADFATQQEAQEEYDRCAEEIAKYNHKTTEEMKSYDVYGLDGDNDGDICEALR